MTTMLSRKDKFDTVHSKSSKNPTVNLSALCNSCAKIACRSQWILTFLYAGSSIQNSPRVSTFRV